jgi:protein TonB
MDSGAQADVVGAGLRGHMQAAHKDNGVSSHSKRAYRPPVGIPTPKERTVGSAITSVVLHVLIILLLIVPLFAPDAIAVVTGGAGGPGPAGGGGGGRGGKGGTPETDRERLQFVRVVEPPKPVPPVPTPVIPPPKPQEEVPKVDIKTDAPPDKVEMSLVSGTGGGTGNDGSAGNGPGTGGGVGSGVGTGRGSATGPGTGGGPGTIYPPTPVETILPPLPVPERIKDTQVKVVFDVDEKGAVVDVTFTPTGDGGYNRKLRERLANYRFRPAVRWDGTPVRAKLEMGLFL